jgi:hypothetical protein
MTGLLQRLREKQDIIQELAENGYFSWEDIEILTKLRLIDKIKKGGGSNANISRPGS